MIEGAVEGLRATTSLMFSVDIGDVVPKSWTNESMTLMGRSAKKIQPGGATIRPGVVSIWQDSDGELSFRGSGIIVDRNHIVTCNHVVNASDRYLVFDGGPYPSRVIARFERDDVALLEVEGPLVSTALPLLVDIETEDWDKLSLTRWAVFGYPQSDSGKELRCFNVKPILRDARAESGTVIRVQVDGGVPQGCSGGPVIASSGREQICLGILFLGGERAATSRLLTSERLTELLSQTMGISLSKLPPKELRRLFFRSARPRARRVSAVVAFSLIALLGVVAYLAEEVWPPKSSRALQSSFPLFGSRTKVSKRHHNVPHLALSKDVVEKAIDEIHETGKLDAPSSVGAKTEVTARPFIRPEVALPSTSAKSSARRRSATKVRTNGPATADGGSLTQGGKWPSLSKLPGDSSGKAGPHRGNAGLDRNSQEKSRAIESNESLKAQLETHAESENIALARSPKILFLAEEHFTNEAGDEVTIEHTPLRALLEDALLAKGFDLVAAEHVEKLRKEEREVFEGLIAGSEKAVQVAMRYGAEYIVTASAHVKYESYNDLGQGEHHGFAELVLRAINGSTGAVIASFPKSGHSPANAFSEEEMRSKVLRRLAPGLADNLILRIMETWKRQASIGARYIVKLYRVVGYGKYGLRFIELLKNVPGVRDVKKISYGGGRLEVEVFYPLNLDVSQLEQAIVKAASTDRELRDIDLSFSRGRELSFTL